LAPLAISAASASRNGRIGQDKDQQVTRTQISPLTRMTFYIGIETLAQIENYSFSVLPNLGTASLTAPFDEIFLLAVRHQGIQVVIAPWW
jgi:hypothetical protein